MRRPLSIVRAILALSCILAELDTYVAHAEDTGKKKPSAALGLCRCVSPFGEDEYARLLLQRCAASEEECQKVPCDVPRVRSWQPNAKDCKGARPGAAPPNQYDPMTDFR